MMQVDDDDCMLWAIAVDGERRNEEILRRRGRRRGLIGDVDSRGVECRDFEQADGFRGRGGQFYGLGGGKADAAGCGGHCH